MVAIGGSPPLTITQDSQGNFVALVTITNEGNVTVASVQVTTTGTTLGQVSLLFAPPPVATWRLGTAPW